VSSHAPLRITAFAGDRLIASGTVVDVARAAKEVQDGGHSDLVRFFDHGTGRRLDLDLEGTPAEVADRAEWLRAAMADQSGTTSSTRGRGRPKLGVVAKEVTLLPRHWAWLNSQRGSASATLRRLVDDARKASVGTDRVHRAQDAAYRFMYDRAGNAPGFEEAMRSLYAADRDGFLAATEGWPGDVRDYARELASGAFTAPSGPDAPGDR
jgi:hypothetical protein